MKDILKHVLESLESQRKKENGKIDLEPDIPSTISWNYDLTEDESTQNLPTKTEHIKNMVNE